MISFAIPGVSQYSNAKGSANLLCLIQEYQSLPWNKLLADEQHLQPWPPVYENWKCLVMRSSPVVAVAASPTPVSSTSNSCQDKTTFLLGHFWASEFKNLWVTIICGDGPNILCILARKDQALIWERKLFGPDNGILKAQTHYGLMYC